MERVVYLLGAGFSAPLGIPTVADFIERARDLYFSNKVIYADFAKTLSDIQGLARVKTIFKSNTMDLEEVLSILTTEQELEGTARADEFIKLISGVVRDSMRPVPNDGSQLWQHHMGGTANWSPYLKFVASLFQVWFEPLPPLPGQQQNSKVDQIGSGLLIGEPYQYDVVSLNYDSILETATNWIANKMSVPNVPWMHFKRDQTMSSTIQESGCHRPLLAKLHGCSLLGNIVAPTANKRLKDLEDQWRMAYTVLKEANHVRVIGYSLPEGDAAVRYLLKSAMSKTEHLKTFDVLCKDPDGTVAARYDAFVDFRKSIFTNGDTVHYLNGIQPWAHGNIGNSLSFGGLEHAHAQMFKTS